MDFPGFTITEKAFCDNEELQDPEVRSRLQKAYVLMVKAKGPRPWDTPEMALSSWKMCPKNPGITGDWLESIDPAIESLKDFQRKQKELLKTLLSLG